MVIANQKANEQLAKEKRDRDLKVSKDFQSYAQQEEILSFVENKKDEKSLEEHI